MYGCHLLFQPSCVITVRAPISNDPEMSCADAFVYVDPPAFHFSIDFGVGFVSFQVALFAAVVRE